MPARYWAIPEIKQTGMGGVEDMGFPGVSQIACGISRG